MDDVCTLRVWAKLDDFFHALTEALHIRVCPAEQMHRSPAGEVFIVPYNKSGRLDPRCRMTLDLTSGVEIQIAAAATEMATELWKLVNGTRSGVGGSPRPSRGP